MEGRHRRRAERCPSPRARHVPDVAHESAPSRTLTDKTASALPCLRPPSKGRGAAAHICKQGVVGSSPIVSNRYPGHLSNRPEPPRCTTRGRRRGHRHRRVGEGRTAWSGGSDRVRVQDLVPTVTHCPHHDAASGRRGLAAVATGRLNSAESGSTVSRRRRRGRPVGGTFGAVLAGLRRRHAAELLNRRWIRAILSPGFQTCSIRVGPGR